VAGIRPPPLFRVFFNFHDVLKLNDQSAAHLDGTRGALWLPEGAGVLAA